MVKPNRLVMTKRLILTSLSLMSTNTPMRKASKTPRSEVESNVKQRLARNLEILRVFSLPKRPHTLT